MKIKSTIDNVWDLFNELYYINKDKYNEETNSLNTKDKKLLYHKKLRLTDDYQYEPEKEKEEKQQTSIISHKKESPKKPTKDDLSEINKWVNEKEPGINS